MGLVAKLVITAVSVAALTNPQTRVDLAQLSATVLHAAAKYATTTTTTTTSTPGTPTSAGAPFSHLGSTPGSSAATDGGTAPAAAAPPVAVTGERAHTSAAATAAKAPDSSGAWRFSAMNPDGSPVRWDPCRPVYYAVNAAQAPYPSALSDVQQAMQEISAATGISFVFSGQVSTALTSGHADQVSRDGRGTDAAMLIGWARPDQSDVLGGGTNAPVGETVTSWSNTARGNAYQGSVTVLNATKADYSPGFGPGFRWGSVLLHELGHAVGLAHTTVASQIMYAYVGGGAYELGAGDRTGLARLGKGGCLPS